MTVCVNGMKREVAKGITLQELIELFKVNQKSVVLELNREIIDRNSFSTTQLEEDDAVEIVQFVGGG